MMIIYVIMQYPYNLQTKLFDTLTFCTPILFDTLAFRTPIFDPKHDKNCIHSIRKTFSE